MRAVDQIGRPAEVERVGAQRVARAGRHVGRQRGIVLAHVRGRSDRIDVGDGALDLLKNAKGILWGVDRCITAKHLDTC